MTVNKIDFIPNCNPQPEGIIFYIRVNDDSEMECYVKNYILDTFQPSMNNSPVESRFEECKDKLRPIIQEQIELGETRIVIG